MANVKTKTKTAKNDSKTKFRTTAPGRNALKSKVVSIRKTDFITPRANLVNRKMIEAGSEAMQNPENGAKAIYQAMERARVKALKEK